MSDHKLHHAAYEALKSAYAPYSKFKVGAALRTQAGRIYKGCNIEISSYSLTICAERVAIFKAISDGEMDFDSIAITSAADAFCPPCGACRQTLADFAPALRIILLKPDGATQETSIQELLPQAFDKSYLENFKS